jgi:hypothetical protein
MKNKILRNLIKILLIPILLFSYFILDNIYGFNYSYFGFTDERSFRLVSFLILLPIVFKILTYINEINGDN